MALLSTRNLFLLLSTAQSRENFWSNQYYKVDLRSDFEALAAAFSVEEKTINYAQLEQIMNTITSGYRRAFIKLSMTEAHGALRPKSVAQSFKGLRCSCTDCTMLPWKKLEQLETHQWVHTPSDNWHCSLCYRRYFIQHTLLSHLSRRTKRDVAGEFLENVTYKQLMETQQQQELQKGSTQVEQLNVRLSKRHHLDYVAETETRVQPTSRKRRSLSKCVYCDHIYRYSFSHQLHMRQSHSPMHYSPRWQCYSCSRSFRTRRTYVQHLQRVRQACHQRLRRFKCSSCKRRFQLERSLKQHVAIAHSRSFRCLICNLPSHGRCCDAHSAEECRAAIRKRRQEQGRKPRPPRSSSSKVVCNFCQKKYSTPFLLNIHMKRVHLKQADFICDQCAKAFYSNAGVQEHIKRVHLKTETVYCEPCNLTIAERKNYLRHCDSIRHVEQLRKLAKIKGELPPDAVVEKHVPKGPIIYCEPCDRHIKDYVNFRSHCKTQKHERKLAEQQMRKDSNIEPVHQKTESVYCEPCGQTITNRKNYSRHCDSTRHVEQLTKLAKIQGEIPHDAVVEKHVRKGPLIYCEVCDCHIKEYVNFRSHCESKKHKRQLAEFEKNLDSIIELDIN